MFQRRRRQKWRISSLAFLGNSPVIVFMLESAKGGRRYKEIRREPVLGYLPIFVIIFYLLCEKSSRAKVEFSSFKT